MPRKFIRRLLAALLLSALLWVEAAAAEGSSGVAAVLTGSGKVDPGEIVTLTLSVTGLRPLGVSFEVVPGSDVTLLSYTCLQEQWLDTRIGNRFTASGTACAGGDALFTFQCKVSDTADTSEGVSFAVKNLLCSNGIRDYDLGTVSWRVVLMGADSVVISGAVFETPGLEVALYAPEGAALEAQTTLLGSECVVGGVSLPAFWMELRKDGCVPCSLEIAPQNGAFALPEGICLVAVGDVNGSGDLSPADMQCLYTYLATGENEGTIADGAYFARVADVNGDGGVDILDYQALYELLK